MARQVTRKRSHAHPVPRRLRVATALAFLASEGDSPYGDLSEEEKGFALEASDQLCDLADALLQPLLESIQDPPSVTVNVDATQVAKAVREATG